MSFTYCFCQCLSICRLCFKYDNVRTLGHLTWWLVSQVIQRKLLHCVIPQYH